jgi:protein TonB
MTLVSIRANRFRRENTMFTDSMPESSWTHRSRRSWTTLTSIGLQVAAVATLIILPILRNVALPTARTVSTPIALGQIDRPGLPMHPQGGRSSAPVRYFDPRGLMLPSPFHSRFPQGNESTELQPPDGFGVGNGIGLPSGGANGLLLPITSGDHPVMPSPPPAVTRAFRTSSMLQGSLIHQVQPVYPPLARSARIQGSVVLFALISKAGTIENLQAISGHPLLVSAAIDAVRQWKYQPYILNHEPIEVETQITVNFVLGN